MEIELSSRGGKIILDPEEYFERVNVIDVSLTVKEWFHDETRLYVTYTYQ